MADFDPRLLNFLPAKVAEEIWKDSELARLPKGTELLRAEQYVKVLPIVLEGLVKVISRFDDRDLLLYYIEPNQSCIMTFYSALNNTQSKVFASVEEARNHWKNPSERARDKNPKLGVTKVTVFHFRIAEVCRITKNFES